MQTDKFPASAAFEAINAALTSSEDDRKDAIKQGGAVFAFTLKNAAGETESWHIDLKEKGEVKKGLPEKPTGMYPDQPTTIPACLASYRGKLAHELTGDTQSPSCSRTRTSASWSPARPTPSGSSWAASSRSRAT